MSAMGESIPKMDTSRTQNIHINIQSYRSGWKRDSIPICNHVTSFTSKRCWRYFYVVVVALLPFECWFPFGLNTDFMWRYSDLCVESIFDRSLDWFAVKIYFQPEAQHLRHPAIRFSYVNWIWYSRQTFLSQFVWVLVHALRTTHYTYSNIQFNSIIYRSEIQNTNITSNLNPRMKRTFEQILFTIRRSKSYFTVLNSPTFFLPQSNPEWKHIENSLINEIQIDGIKTDVTLCVLYERADPCY